MGPKAMLELFCFRQKWKKINKNNATRPMNVYRINSVRVVRGTYGCLRVLNDTINANLNIGCYCSIANNVTFLLGKEHYTNHISSYPFKVMALDLGGLEAISKGDIIIDDDVWIGYGTTILSGIHISQGAVVAVGAVVTKDVPPYAIVGGVQAKVIKYRFEPEMIEELIKVDYSKLTKEQIEQHIDELYAGLKDKKQLDWMPKKERK